MASVNSTDIVQKSEILNLNGNQDTVLLRSSYLRSLTP